MSDSDHAAALSLDLIRRDGGTQPRDRISNDVAKAYAEAIAEGATFPPITAFYDGSEYWLADGFHRVVAHELLGLAEIDAEVRQGVRRDAILYSVGANAAHGYRRSNADKRRAVLTLLGDPEWAAWSDREIARRCAVDHKTVSALRPSGEVPQIDRTVERNGTTYTMNTAAIGKSADDQPAEKDMETAETVEAPSRRTGPQMFIPEGGDIVALCRKGIDLEAAGQSCEAVASELGLAANTYRISRQIVFLADRPELSVSDKAVAAEALHILVTTLQHTLAWKVAEPVAVKLWGDAPRWNQLATLAERRLDQFERTFGIVMQSCLTTEEVELPYLSAEQVRRFAREIGAARKALAAFASRMQEIHG